MICHNDITETETTLFADDSCLFKFGRHLDFILRKMQTSLNKVVEWCDLNGFKISMEKTVVVPLILKITSMVS